MSKLQVTNIHLESTGNNRIQYSGSNTITGANLSQARSRLVSI